MTSPQNRDDASAVLRLADGRRLGYLRCGAPDGEPLFYCHGTPGSRLEAALIDDVAAALGLSVIAVDRPGYGLSDPQPGRRPADWPRAVAQLADALGIHRFGIVGISGGGPYALACAQALAPRLTGVDVVCGVGPVYLPALAAQMPPFERGALRLERSHPALLSTLYGAPLAVLARRAPRAAVRLLAWRCGGADRPVLLRPDIEAALAANLAESLARGTQGAVHDVHAMQRPWGFDPHAIRIPVRFWHGTSDPIVPHSHSDFLHHLISGSSLNLVPEAGHFSLPVLHAHTILSTRSGSENSFRQC